MPEEEKTEVEETEVEETKTAEDEKTEVEEKVVEEKTVEEAKVEEKTEPAKEAPDAEEDTKTGGGSGGSGIGTDASEEALEMLKAALPETLPLGTVLKVNKRLYFPNQSGKPSVNVQAYVIGLPDGNVGTYVPADSDMNTEAEVAVMSYDELIETIAICSTGVHMESALCGCAMPSKDSTQFVANITVINTQDK